MEAAVYRGWLSDGTSVIEITFWRDVAERVYHLVSMQGNTEQDDSDLIMHVKRFTVRGDDRRHLTPLKWLTAAASAEVDRSVPTLLGKYLW